MGRVEFTEEAIKEYIDNVIEFWRGRRDSADEGSRDRFMAVCYVDAFQSVRVSLFEELLPDKDIGNPYPKNASEWSGGSSPPTEPPEHGTIGDPKRR